MVNDIGSFDTLFDLAKNLGNLTKTLLGRRGGQSPQSDLSDIASISRALALAVASAQTDYLAVQQRNRELEEEIARMKAWDAESQQYQLREVGVGAFALVYQPAVDGPEPVHWLCTNCAENKRKSILQGRGYASGRYVGQTLRLYGCATCGLEIRARS